MTVSGGRDEFLKRVREAVAEGNRAGGAPAPPARGGVGYQGAGDDPVARLGAELAAAGGRLHVVKDAAEAAAVIARLIQEKGARTVLVGDGPVIDSLDLKSALPGVAVIQVRELEPGREREPFFAADVGVSGVEGVIAETGSLVLETRRDQPRALSLLVPVHVAVARREQILPDLFDLFTPGLALPGCLTLITGPSKTGDIELRLVTGVHGPGEVHLVLIAD
jgi:L-lactate utilization protein LutC